MGWYWVWVQQEREESEVADVLHRFSWFQYVRHGIRPLANRAVLSGLISRKLSKQAQDHSLTLYTWWWRWCSGAHTHTHFRFLLFVVGIIRWKTTLWHPQYGTKKNCRSGSDLIYGFWSQSFSFYCAIDWKRQNWIWSWNICRFGFFFVDRNNCKNKNILTKQNKTNILTCFYLYFIRDQTSKESDKNVP